MNVKLRYKINNELKTARKMFPTHKLNLLTKSNKWMQSNSLLSIKILISPSPQCFHMTITISLCAL
jgi:hypothetical protein